jgi:hypothetical protein
MPLSERIAALLSLTKYGPLIPCWGVVFVDGSWVCECRDPACTHKVSKHPRILWSWQSSKDPAQIAAWAEKWPLANWAIKAGETDLVDLDRKVGKPDGVATLQSWEEELGVKTPETRRVSTSNGGRHLYFRGGSGLETTSNADRTGIDVRSTGGYFMAPGSRHVFGHVYEVALDAELAECPAWLVEKINGKSPNRINGVTIRYTRGVWLGGGAPGNGGRTKDKARGKAHARVAKAREFTINPSAELTAARRADLEMLRCQRPKLRATWTQSRAESPWPFKQGRNSPSEYEGSIVCHLIWAGWSMQEVMDTLVVWRRERGLEYLEDYARYACTLRKAFALITPRAKWPSARKDPPKGAWRHAETRERILCSILNAPMSPPRIAEVTGLDLAHVKVVLGRLLKSGQVVRDNHTYLCAPCAAPWYTREIPADIGNGEAEFTPPEAGNPVELAELAAMEAEFQEYLARMEAGPEFAGVFTQPTAIVDDAEPELVAVQPDPPVEAVPIFIDDEWPFGTRESRAAYLAEWEAKYKLENREHLREARKRSNYQSMASLKREAKAKKELKSLSASFQLDDRDSIRLEELDAERALRRLDEEDLA